MKRPFARHVAGSITVSAFLALAMMPATPSLSAAPQPGSRVLLSEGWKIQSSAKATEPGSVISTASFSPSGWYSTTVPSTVLATLVAHTVYPDPDFGMNLPSIPGASYPIGGNFSMIDRPKGSPFRPAWWFRTQFSLPAAWSGKKLWLHFNGINNSADIWLNGRQVADRDRVTGMCRTYDFNVTRDASPGAENTLAVAVFPPTPHDLSITFVDWNPLPPDKDMGIFRSVYFTSSGPVALRNPQLVTHFDLPSINVARVTVAADLENATDRAVEGFLKARFGDVSVSQHVTLQPGETRRVEFTPEKSAAGT